MIHLDLMKADDNRQAGLSETVESQPFESRVERTARALQLVLQH